MENQYLKHLKPLFLYINNLTMVTEYKAKQIKLILLKFAMKLNHLVKMTCLLWCTLEFLSIFLLQVV